MDGQHVGARPQFLGAHAFDAVLLAEVRNIEAVAREDLHAVRLQQLHDFLADMAAAVDADGVAAQVRAKAHRAFPFAALEHRRKEVHPPQRSAP